MKTLTILIILVFVSCVPEVKSERKPSEYALTCEEYLHDLFFIIRCENKEVICYRAYRTGLQCKFK